MTRFPHPAPIVGILAGGKGSRMGGIDKAALPSPAGSLALLWRTTDLVEALGLTCVLVGVRPALKQQRPKLTYLNDEPAGVGPLGGLGALLEYAAQRPCLLLACDMPYLQAELVAQLASSPSAAAVLAPKDAATGKWQPFFARYQSPVVAPVLTRALRDGVRSFQQLFDTLSPEELPLTPQQRMWLVDWDTPEDMKRK